MFGAYAVTDGTLAWTGEPAGTLMACPDELRLRTSGSAVS